MAGSQVEGWGRVAGLYSDARRGIDGTRPAPLEHSPATPLRAYPRPMGQQPEPTATSEDYARLGVRTTDAEISETRARIRQQIRELDATWTPERWEQLDRRIDAA